MTFDNINKKKGIRDDRIIQGWRKFVEGYEPTPLTPEEELKIERMLLVHRHPQRIRFIPSEEVKEMGASATR